MMIVIQLSVIFCLFLPLLEGKRQVVTIEELSDAKALQYINRHDRVLVIFHADDCDGCVEQMEALHEIAESITIPDMKMVRVMNSHLAELYGIERYPQLLFFRKTYPILFNAEKMSSSEAGSWLEENKDVSSQVLDNANFEHLTQAATGATTGDWFIMFYQTECRTLLATWESVSARIKYKTNVAVVDTSANPLIRQRFDINVCPQFIYFRLGKMYPYTGQMHSTRAFIAFSEVGYKNAAGKKVPIPATPFDNFTNGVVQILKASPIFIALFFGATLVVIVAVILVTKRSRVKFE